MAVLFMPFGFLGPKDLKIIWLSNILALSVPDQGNYRNGVARTNFDIYDYIRYK